MSLSPLTIGPLLLLGVACGSPAARDAGARDASVDAEVAAETAAEAPPVCFPCQGYWTCGGAPTRIDLVSEADGCHLPQLPGPVILEPDGTITENGGVVASAVGTGARVVVTYPDGGLWLVCAAGGGCP